MVYTVIFKMEDDSPNSALVLGLIIGHGCRIMGYEFVRYPDKEVSPFTFAGDLVEIISKNRQ